MVVTFQIFCSFIGLDAGRSCCSRLPAAGVTAAAAALHSGRGLFGAVTGSRPGVWLVVECAGLVACLPPVSGHPWAA
jgi:hypothetical protein